MPTARDWVATWSSAAWRAEALDWAGTQLAQRGVQIQPGTTQPRVRIWSTQLRIPTNCGSVWLKADNPGLAAETRVVETLNALVPDSVVTPWVVDHERGWLLGPDRGPTLRADVPTTVEQWVRIVTVFAGIQRQLEGHAEALESTGISVFHGPSARTTLERFPTTIAPRRDWRRTRRS